MKAFLVLPILLMNQVGLPENTTTPVVAKGVSSVPGAIICPNMDTTSALFEEYVSNWEEQYSAQVTRGQSALIHGAPSAPPNPKDWGCVLVRPGTKMLLEQGNVVPVVRVTLANGKKIRGVTLGAMLLNPESIKAQKDADTQATVTAMAQAKVVAETPPQIAWTASNGSPVYKEGHGVISPRYLTRVNASYSELAKELGAYGMCVVQFVVDPRGNVSYAKITSSLGDELDKAALAAVRQDRFSPGILNGQPVAVLMEAKFNFTHLSPQYAEQQ